MEDLRPDDPRQLGQYRLLGRIGSGAMGLVFLGRSPGGRLVAVKVIRPELTSDPGFRARFKQEVAAARAVNGIFTAIVVDADVDGQVLWLATAYVQAPSLAEQVAEHGPLPAGTVMALAAGLAESLKAIHAAGIVHRDLKPSNVLLAEDGPRVVDFGISRALEGTSLTDTGMIVGTPAFMSPEQAGGGDVGQRSDIFSLGAVLVFAVTGEGPFGTGMPVALLYRVINNPPDTSRVPDKIRSLIEQCLAKNPAERPGADELLAQLGTAQPTMNWLPAGLVHASGRSDQAQSRQHEAAHAGADKDWPAAGYRSNTDSRQTRLDRVRQRRGRDGATGATVRAMFGRSQDSRIEEISESLRVRAEAEQLYGDLSRISTAPEFASRLSGLAAQAFQASGETSTWPAGTVPADISAVRSGRLVPGKDVLDAILASSGVSPGHLQPWHAALDRVNAATGAVIELRARVIEFARDLDLTAKAYRRRRSAEQWLGGLARARDQRRDPGGLNRVSTYGQLRGLARALAVEAERISQLTGINLHGAVHALGKIPEYDDEGWLLDPGLRYAQMAVEALAAIQVDASGVDLSNLNMHEPDAARGVIWTAYTTWPASISDAVSDRSRKIRPDAFQVT